MQMTARGMSGRERSRGGERGTGGERGGGGGVIRVLFGILQFDG